MKRKNVQAARRLRMALLASVGMLAVAAPEAMAQAPAVQRQPAGQVFAIAPQGLNAALLEFTRLTGIDLVYDGAIAADLASPGVTGTFAPDQALTKLLSGTGLVFHFTNARTVVLSKAAADGAMTLDPVTVEGAAMVQQSEENAYAPVRGYVAKRSATATKTDATILETPQSISVVGAEEMETRNVYSYEDAIKYTPGIYLPRGTTGDTRVGYSYIRGFSSTYEYADGMKLIGAWWSRMDFYNAERVEILRGPASVMYGQSIPGGLVNLVSKRPQEEQMGEAALEYGSYDWTRAEADITGPLDEKKHWLYRVSAAAQTSDGLNDIDGDQLNRNLLAPSLTWKDRESTSLTLMAVRQEDEHQGYIKRIRYRTSVGESSPSTYLGQSDFDTFELKRTSITALGEHTFNNNLKLNVNARWSNYDLNYRTAWPGNVQADGRTINQSVYLYNDSGDTYQFDARLEGKAAFAGMEHTITGGADYSYQTTDFFRGGLGNAASMDLFSGRYTMGSALPTQTASNDQTRLLGFYMQDQVRVADKWFLLLGGRQDMPGISESSDFQDAFTGRVGLAYKTDFGLVPYASYAESFEPQSGTSWTGGKFEPTTGRQYEVGMKYEPPGVNAMATVALFDLRKQNVLTDDSDTSHLCNGGTCSVQTGEAASRGVELGLTMGLAEGLNAVASYTYNPMEVTKSNVAGEVGRQMYDQPIHLASLWLDYSLKSGPWSGLGFGGGLRFVGKTVNYGGDIATSPYVVDEEMVRYDAADWRLSLNVKNILDREIEYGCSRSDNAEYCYLNEPLTVTARVARRF